MSKIRSTQEARNDSGKEVEPAALILKSIRGPLYYLHVAQSRLARILLHFLSLEERCIDSHGLSKPFRKNGFLPLPHERRVRGSHPAVRLAQILAKPSPPLPVSGE